MWRPFLIVLGALIVGSLGLLLIINELAVISPSLNAQNSSLILQSYIVFFTSIFTLGIIGVSKVSSFRRNRPVTATKLT